MKTEQKRWLDEYAVTCRAFKGRWNIRHCLRMYNEIDDLKIQMSTRANGKVTRHQSTYNPCKRCKVLVNYLKSRSDDRQTYDHTRDTTYSEVWAV